MAPSHIHPEADAGRPGGPRRIFSEAILSRTEEIEPLVGRFMDCIGQLVAVDGFREAIELSLREALVNAIVHGNRLDPAKKVQVECFRLPDRHILLVVRDQGHGFDSAHLEDPTRPENLERATGRGIFLIRQFMDQVDFRDSGREIQMKKKC